MIKLEKMDKITGARIETIDYVIRIDNINLGSEIGRGELKINDFSFTTLADYGNDFRVSLSSPYIDLIGDVIAVEKTVESNQRVWRYRCRALSVEGKFEKNMRKHYSDIVAEMGLDIEKNFLIELTKEKYFRTSHPRHYDGDDYGIEAVYKDGDDYLIAVGSEIWSFDGRTFKKTYEMANEDDKDKMFVIKLFKENDDLYCWCINQEERSENKKQAFDYVYRYKLQSGKIMRVNKEQLYPYRLQMIESKPIRWLYPIPPYNRIWMQAIGGVFPDVGTSNGMPERILSTDFTPPAEDVELDWGTRDFPIGELDVGIGDVIEIWLYDREEDEDAGEITYTLKENHLCGVITDIWKTPITDERVATCGWGFPLPFAVNKGGMGVPRVNATHYVASRVRPIEAYKFTNNVFIPYKQMVDVISDNEVKVYKRDGLRSWGGVNEEPIGTLPMELERGYYAFATQMDFSYDNKNQICTPAPEKFYVLFDGFEIEDGIIPTKLNNQHYHSCYFTDCYGGSFKKDGYTVYNDKRAYIFDSNGNWIKSYYDDDTDEANLYEKGHIFSLKNKSNKIYILRYYEKMLTKKLNDKYLPNIIKLPKMGEDVALGGRSISKLLLYYEDKRIPDLESVIKIQNDMLYNPSTQLEGNDTRLDITVGCRLSRWIYPLTLPITELYEWWSEQEWNENTIPDELTLPPFVNEGKYWLIYYYLSSFSTEREPLVIWSDTQNWKEIEKYKQDYPDYPYEPVERLCNEIENIVRIEPRVALEIMDGERIGFITIPKSDDYEIKAEKRVGVIELEDSEWVDEINGFKHYVADKEPVAVPRGEAVEYNNKLYFNLMDVGREIKIKTKRYTMGNIDMNDFIIAENFIFDYELSKIQEIDQKVYKARSDWLVAEDFYIRSKYKSLWLDVERKEEYLDVLSKICVSLDKIIITGGLKPVIQDRGANGIYEVRYPISMQKKDELEYRRPVQVSYEDEWYGSGKNKIQTYYEDIDEAKWLYVRYNRDMELWTIRALADGIIPQNCKVRFNGNEGILLDVKFDLEKREMNMKIAVLGEQEEYV